MSDAITWLDRADQGAFLLVNQWLHALAREESEVATVLRVGNEMGNGWILAVFLFALIAIEDNAGRAFRRVAEVGLAALSSGMISYWIKRSVDRARPQKALADAFADGEALRGFGEVFRGSSFPSGHTATAFSIAVIFAWWAGSIDTTWRRVTVRIAVFFMASLTGVARIYGGAHYPLDVIGGAALGVLCGWCVMALSTWALGRRVPYGGGLENQLPT